jgi:hypothetical protein
MFISALSALLPVDLPQDIVLICDSHSATTRGALESAVARCKAAIQIFYQSS